MGRNRNGVADNCHILAGLQMFQAGQCRGAGIDENLHAVFDHGGRSLADASFFPGADPDTLTERLVAVMSVDYGPTVDPARIATDLQLL